MNGRETLKERLGELAAAFALLTRLPVARFDLPAPQDPAASAWAYPLVGATIGLLGGLAYAVAYALSIPPILAALLAIAATIVATGAMHEDGLADTSDALAGQTRGERLDIMRDSRIGTYGVLALILSVGIRASALALLAEPGLVLAALVTAMATSRASAPALMAGLPHARADGLSFAMGRPTGAMAAAAGGIALVIAILLVPFAAVLWIVVTVGVATFAVALAAQSKLGGQTGDVLGANVQLSEVVALTLLAAFASGVRS